MPTETIKHFQLKILTKLNFTDNRLLVLREKKPSSDIYSGIMQQTGDISSDNSKNILKFIANYDNGFFLPEKCDAYEPIREKFDPKNLNAPSRWLSQPGCAVYLKKIKPFKFEGVIENHCLAMVWDENGIPLSVKKGTYAERDPYYLGEVWLHIDEKLIKLKSDIYLFEFFSKLYKTIDGEYGFIKNHEGHTLIEKGELITI